MIKILEFFSIKIGKNNKKMKHYHRLTAIEIGTMHALKKLDKSVKFIARKTGRDPKTVRDALKLPVTHSPRTVHQRLPEGVRRRRNFVFRYADMVSSRTVSWKVWEGTKREQTRRRLYQFPMYPTAKAIEFKLFHTHKISATAWTVNHDLVVGGFCWKKRKKVVSMNPDLWPVRDAFSISTLAVLPNLKPAFADECSISMAVDGTFVFHYRRRGQPALPRVVGRASGVSEKCHIWAIIGPNGFRDIVMFDTTVSSEVYISQCLMKVKVYLKAKKLTLIHDNAGSHTASQRWMDDNRVLYLAIPPYSPDLNVIEELWPHLKRRVAARFPTVRNFRQIVLEEFNLLPQSTIDGILASFKKKLETCKRRGGRHFDI